MSLLVLMYHRAVAGRLGNSPARLREHFAHLSDTHPNVMPGVDLAPGRLNVCLTFDDGYYDFYAHVYPLLRIYNLRALLAIPPGLIRDRAQLAHEERLRLSVEAAFAQPDLGGFCTWGELQEMADSGYVTLAAHGYLHRRLDEPGVSLTAELDHPHAVLCERLGQPVDAFVFPYGATTWRARERARRRYRFLLRIGGAMNRSWDTRMLYRVDADEMETPDSLFAPGNLTRYRARCLWNRLRGK